MKKTEDIYERLASDDPVSSSVFLNGILEKYGIDIHSPENRVSLLWKNLAGEHIASVSSCTGVEKGVLYVVCGHPAHAQLVRMNKAEIIKNIKSVFPDLEVEKIKVRIKQQGGFPDI